MSSAQECVMTTANLLSSIRPSCLSVDQSVRQWMKSGTVLASNVHGSGPLIFVVHRMKNISVGKVCTMT